jgi:hypothetical protein
MKSLAVTILALNLALNINAQGFLSKFEQNLAAKSSSSD